jgi:hypothetical protein
VILARRALVDVSTVAIVLAVLGCLVKLKKIPEPVLILAAGAIGMALHHSGS